MDDRELPLDARPAVLIGLAVDRWGEAGFIDRCVGLLETMSWADEPDLMSYLGGVRGPRFVEFGLGREGYWLRVWPLRAMLYAWNPRAERAVVAAMSDEHWRVREMACKVVVRREIGAGAEQAGALLGDPVARVRAAAARALAEVGEAEHGPGLRSLLTDEDPQVASRAEQSLRRLAERTDRSPDQLGT